MTDAEKLARDAFCREMSINASDFLFGKLVWNEAAAYRDALPPSRCEHGVIKVDHCYSCDAQPPDRIQSLGREIEASQAKASLYHFSCCGGNDDPLKDSKPGDHDYYEKAHTMDCDEHPGVTPPQAKASAEFPEAEYFEWIEKRIASRESFAKQAVARWAWSTAFEKGRESDPGVANILLSLSKSNQYIADLEAKLREANAEIERLNTLGLLHAQQRSENQERRPDQTE